MPLTRRDMNNVHVSSAKSHGSYNITHRRNFEEVELLWNMFKAVADDEKFAPEKLQNVAFQFLQCTWIDAQVFESSARYDRKAEDER